MKKLFILLGLFLTLTASGQVMSGVVASRAATAAPAPFDDGMLTNGDFSDGQTGWTDDDANFIIADGYATFLDNASADIIQPLANMDEGIANNGAYTVTFTLTLVTATSAYIALKNDTETKEFFASTEYTSSGTVTMNFTAPGYGANPTGLKVACSSASNGSFRIDNITLNPQ